MQTGRGPGCGAAPIQVLPSRSTPWRARLASERRERSLELHLGGDGEGPTPRIGDARLPGAAGAGIAVIGDGERGIAVEQILDAGRQAEARREAAIAERKIVDDVVLHPRVVVRPGDRA